jgi:uncharacterized RDD family membrane protein YckC
MEQASQPAAWYADPSGRHEQRYWSGSGWTEHVADRGQQSVDPLAPGAAPSSGPPQQAGGWQQPPPQQAGGWQQPPPQQAGGWQQPPPQQAGGWQQPPPQQAGGWQQAPSPGGWQQPPPQAPGGTSWPGPGWGGRVGQPADLGPRFLARLVDFVLLGIVSAIIGGIIVAGLVLGSSGNFFSTYGVGRGGSYAANALSSVISALITWGYFTLMESSRGQTLGKMLLKLRTVGPGGDRPTFEQALKRNAFTAIPILGVIPVVGFLSGLLSLVAVITIAVTINRNTATRRGWHDDFAGGTDVVRTG